MQHLDPGSIGVAALDEPLDAPSQQHLDGCDQCAAEVRELNSVVVTARGDSSEARLDFPDSQVWEGIHRDLGLQPSLLPDPLTTDPWPGGAESRPLPADPLTPGTRPRDAATRPSGNAATFESRSSRQRTFTTRFLIAAVSVGVLTGAAALWAVQMLGAGSFPEVVAEVGLDPLDGYTAEGSATVLAAEDGARTLRITLTEEQADGYQEVWLIAPDLEQMYSLGILRDGSASLAIPDSVDLAAFPIVDVSDEPLDGDPTHSGVSVLRGSLPTVTG